MKTAEFFNLFKTHQLGNRRSLGSYRVLDGDHCQVLVRSRTKYGLPGGSVLIAITFSPEVTLFHGPNYRALRSGVTEDIEGKKMLINPFVLNENVDNLLDSGIIDIDEVNTKMLIEIGDTPWLLEHEPSLLEENHWTWKYNLAHKVGVRCSSIAEALVDLKPRPDIVHGLGWTFKKMPADFKPDALSPEDRKILEGGMPNPMDYGFSVEHCRQDSTSARDIVAPNMLCLIKSYADTVQGRVFQSACEEWNNALARFNITTPLRYEDIVANGGRMIKCGNIVYVEGEVYKAPSYRYTITLNGWHQIVDKSNKVRLRG